MVSIAQPFACILDTGRGTLGDQGEWRVLICQQFSLLSTAMLPISKPPQPFIFSTRWSTCFCWWLGLTILRWPTVMEVPRSLSYQSACSLGIVHRYIGIPYFSSPESSQQQTGLMLHSMKEFETLVTFPQNDLVLQCKWVRWGKCSSGCD